MSAVPILLDAMVSRWADALDDWTVTYGWDGTQNTGDYLMIGADDPFSSEGEAATTEEDFATATREGISEKGSITCVAFSWNGQADGQREATETVYAALKVMQDDIHQYPDLQIERRPEFMVNALNIESTTLHHGLDEDGTQAMLVIRIKFEAYRRADPS